MSKNFVEIEMHPLRRFLEVEAVYTIFKNLIEKQYTTIGESHNFWEIIFVFKGTIYADISDRIVEINEKEFFLHQPYEYHRHFTLNESAEVIIISFDCRSSLLNEISKQVLPINNVVYQLIKNSLAISGGIFEKYNMDFNFIKYDSYNVLDEQLLRNTLENLFIIIINQEREKKAYYDAFSRLQDKNKEKDIISMIINYMNDNIYDNITIQDICEKFNICKTSLSTKFKEKTLMSVIDYYNNIKVMKTIDFLVRDDMNISQVANIFNYSSGQYYSKIFKKYIGVSPRDFIQKNKKKMEGLTVIAKNTDKK